MLAAAVDSIASQQSGKRAVRTREQFEELLAQVRQQAAARVLQIVELLVPVLTHSREVTLALNATDRPSVAALIADLRAQHAALIYSGFVTVTGFSRLRDLDRYLRGMLQRLERAPGEIARDDERMEQVLAVEKEVRNLIAVLPPHLQRDEAVRALPWQVQELRVSLFAQQLGTSGAVSPQRIRKAMDKIRSASST